MSTYRQECPWALQTHGALGLKTEGHSQGPQSGTTQAELVEVLSISMLRENLFADMVEVRSPELVLMLSTLALTAVECLPEINGSGLGWKGTVLTYRSGATWGQLSFCPTVHHVHPSQASLTTTTTNSMACIRLALPYDTPELAQFLEDQHGLTVCTKEPNLPFEPRYNISEKMEVPCIHLEFEGKPWDKEQKKNTVMTMMRCGLIPKWFKVEDRHRYIARGEDLVNDLPFWKGIKTDHRCVIPCHGFYVFPRKLKEHPWFLKRKDGKEIMLLAGLYSIFDDKYTFATVTTKHSYDLSGILRQPLVLTSKEDVELWLGGSATPSWSERLEQITGVPHDDERLPLVNYPVSNGVRDKSKQSSRFIIPLSDSTPRSASTPEPVPKLLQMLATQGQRTPGNARGTDAEGATPSPSKAFSLTAPRSLPSPVKHKKAASRPLKVTVMSRDSSPELAPNDNEEGIAGPPLNTIDNPIVLDNDKSDTNDPQAGPGGGTPILIADGSDVEPEQTTQPSSPPSGQQPASSGVVRSNAEAGPGPRTFEIHAAALRLVGRLRESTSSPEFSDDDLGPTSLGKRKRPAE